MEKRASGSGAGCGCAGETGGNDSAPSIDVPNPERTPPWASGTISTPVGIVPRVATVLRPADVIGSWKARWGIGRMHYEVRPGLYAAGTPDPDSPVLVSANYKMSFDQLRRELTGIDAWILVLDTKGINVWCAAGKGTFGTEEIVDRINRLKLSDVVRHRVIIVPQLGAPGVSAHEVQRRTGFRVVYGPVRASDLPAFLKAGNKATPDMRQVRFGFLDRLVLTPIELAAVVKPALVLIAVLFVLKLVGNPSAPFIDLLKDSLTGFLPFLGAIIAGAIAVPSLLPIIPGRAFAWKGWVLGLIWALIFVWYFSAPMDWGQSLFYLFVLPPLSAYLAVNFTGASTYTSLSGVVRELKTALPAMIVSAGLGGVFLLCKVLGQALKMN